MRLTCIPQTPDTATTTDSDPAATAAAAAAVSAPAGPTVVLRPCEVERRDQQHRHEQRGPVALSHGPGNYAHSVSFYAGHVRPTY